MASHGDRAFFLLFLCLALLFAFMTTTTTANISIIVSGMRVSGRLYCTNTGNVLPAGLSPPLIGASVSATCNVGTTTFVSPSTITSVSGSFTVTIRNADLIFNYTTNTSLPTCTVDVTLPVPQCSALPPAGVLRAPVGLSSTSGEFLSLDLLTRGSVNEGIYIYAFSVATINVEVVAGPFSYISIIVLYWACICRCANSKSP